MDFDALAGQAVDCVFKITNLDLSNALTSSAVGTVDIGGYLNYMNTLNIAPGDYVEAYPLYTVPSPAPVGPIVVTVDIPFDAPADPYSGTFTFISPPAPSGASGGVIEEPEPSHTYQSATVTGVTEYANVRVQPSTDAEIIGQAMLGESISLLSWNADGTWCKIEYAGGTKAGWLHGKFIQP